MKALVYHGPGKRGWDSVADPGIVDPDRRRRADRHLDDLRHRPAHPQGRRARDHARHRARPRGGRNRRGGRRQRHHASSPGDRVLVSCISACGRCRFCKEARYGQCLGGGGWIFGHLIDGAAGRVRARRRSRTTPLYKVPEELSDEQVLFLADILPTAYEVGVLNGMVTSGRRRGDRRRRPDRARGRS